MGRKKGVEFDEGAPDDFDPNNPYKDPVAFFEMREHLVREKWVDIEKAKILREKLRWCYRIEGVNHLQKCRHLVQQYLDATRGVGWGKDLRPPFMHGAPLPHFQIKPTFLVFLLNLHLIAGPKVAAVDSE
ncbi:NADH dehydrogenase [ubiquinone] 1 beta subcomplex subunit 10-A [Capsicum annuum]|uniref:NADH dehydrogenase [ubiquinone] 1 beta subcomplex subunit 10-A n=1 Tax=Capsicum annuum TaxID=4072 RepID=A0A2G2Y7Q8_CAPAN|nr:NADH dehydrogenase [ubiquinone] 1 beta subcomplex subunit 10-A [Capsicum annuum]PHT65793.1 NADH dehydrogenase [ubiquinone] 1 beta subcomplex subunit 10-A [Capsicum annuum]